MHSELRMGHLHFVGAPEWGRMRQIAARHLCYFYFQRDRNYSGTYQLQNKLAYQYRDLLETLHFSAYINYQLKEGVRSRSIPPREEIGMLPP